MSPTRREYERRVNRVMDYIERHPGDDLSLERLARIANFSPHHFHRVFKAMTGETLFDSSQRLRIEKAARALLTAQETVTELALRAGFASAATFARAFKAHFGMSATEWRAGGHRRWREMLADGNSGMRIRKASKAGTTAKVDTASHVSRPTAQLPKMLIRSLPSYRVAYLRYRGAYGPSGIPSLWKRLRKWLVAHELDARADICIGIVYDDPNIAKAETCRYDACAVVPTGFEVERGINLAQTARGRYAVCNFSGNAHEIADVWQHAFTAWLPDSGFAPDDRPCLELFRGVNPVDADTDRFACELCLPIRPL